MPAHIDNSNWAGPNAAGMGGTPDPRSADDGYGLHGSQYSGGGTLGKDKFSPGPNVVGTTPATQLVVDARGTHTY